MKKKHIKELKRIINYDAANVEHKRLLRRLKKSYMSLPPGKKVDLIKDLKNLFEVEE
jgi:hypothetical protein